MADVAGLERMIEPEVTDLGYELVRVCMIGGTSDPTLQIMAERSDTRQLGISDCERISRRLSEVLDLCDPIDGAYRLEVSSPGIDRPLTRPRDYADWTGHEARLTLRDPVDGRKQLSGTLGGIDGDKVAIVTRDGIGRSLPFADIASAKLLLTDKLINATAPLSTDGADKIEVDPRPADEVNEIPDQEEEL
ncbi:MAG: ribosome maturation protein RimP [Sphingomicrobium sp.]